jgi:hypothetical protein
VWVVEAEAVPAVEESAGVEPPAVIVEDELSAVEMAAQGEVKGRIGGGGVMGAENVVGGGLERLFA